MGFYGDHLDRGKVAFQFDRIFTNRKSMDQMAAAGNDGVFAGRFVLVQYDPDGKFFEGDVTTGYYSDGVIYADSDLLNPYTYKTLTKVTSPSISNWESYYQKIGNYYFKLPGETYFNNENDYYIANIDSNNSVYLNQLVRIYDKDFGFTQTYYKCTGGISGAGSIATWTLVNHDNTDSTYLRNYNIDKIAYGNDFARRGYDATVWEKVYSQGQGKFLLIAYLNTIFPAFELYANPPSEQPAVPYIDALSSDALYRIHVPSMFGFRIKEKETTSSIPSDQAIDQIYYNYDKKNNILSTSTRHIDADIYFNKDGMTPSIRRYDNTVLNEILIKPTGASGKTYFDNNGNEIKTDMYELSIHLPMIGNIISNFYDLIYTEERHLDTVWYDPTNAFRNNGNPALNYKTFNPNSVAGLINTFQNRLGQIIKESSSPLTNDSAATLNQNYIYSYEDKFYRAGYDYEYIEVPEYSLVENLTASNYEPGKYYTKTTTNGNDVYNIANGNFNSYTNIPLYRKNINYTPVTVSQEEYLPNTYYVKNNKTNKFVPATETYSYYPHGDLGSQFYQKNISVFKFVKTELEGYVSGQYFYLDKDHNYIKDTQEISPTFKSIPYYHITSANEKGPKTFNKVFAANTFYYLEDNCYCLESKSMPNPDIEHYYEITPTRLATKALIYQPNQYYYYPDGHNSLGNPIGKPKLAEENSVVEGHKPYYYIPLQEDVTYVEVDGKIVVGHALDVAKQKIVNVFSPTQSLNDIYIFSNNKYIPVSSLKTTDIEYNYEVLTVVEATKFFVPGYYYRKDPETGNYNLQMTWSGSSSTQYIELINVVPVSKPFYEGGKYYWYTGTIYDIDFNSSMTVGREYFINTSLYVLNDESERWPYGFEWREQAVFVPASVTLATRKEIPRIFEIEGINNDKSSINGTILTLNKLIANNDVDIRDNTTLTGAINNTRDLLQSIHSNLIPRRILYINDFGQIATSPYSIDQLATLLH